VRKIPGAFSRNKGNGFGLVEDTRDLNRIGKFGTTAIVGVARVLTEGSQAGSGARTFLIAFGRLGAKTEQVGGC
jgi:hypothetical protein